MKFLSVLLLSLCVVKAQQRISELPEITTPAATNWLVIVDNPGVAGGTKKISYANLTAGLGGGTGGSTGSVVNAGVPAIGNVYYATSVTGTNAAPSGGFIVGASSNTSTIGIHSANAIVATNGITAGSEGLLSTGPVSAFGSRVGLQFGPTNTWVVFDGDSLTGGPTGITNITRTYPSIVTNNILTNAFFTLKTNAAVVGFTVATLVANYPTVIRPFKPDATHSSVVLVWAGINDIAASASAATIWARLTNYWGLARADGFKVCAFTVMDYQNQTLAKHQVRMALNALIRQSVNLYDFLVDVDQVFPVALPATEDGIHLTDLASDYLGYVVGDVLYQGQKIGRSSKFNPTLSGSAIRIITGASAPPPALCDNSGRGLATAITVKGTIPIASFEDSTDDCFMIYPFGGSTKFLWKDGLGSVSATTDNYLSLGTPGVNIPKQLTMGDVASAAAVAGLIKGQSGTGTNVVGGDLVLSGGPGTGTGRGGDVIHKTSLTGSTGTATNNISTRFQAVAKYVDLTGGAATAFQKFTLSSNNYAGIFINATTYASDAAFAFQSLSSTLKIDAVNVGGTNVVTITQVDNTLAQIPAGGTLTCTYTAVDEGSNVFAIKADAASSLTETLLRVEWVIDSLNSSAAITVTPQ
jgi:hypothetical protein